MPPDSPAEEDDSSKMQVEWWRMLDWDEMKRSSERREVTITMDVTLRKGQRFVECSAHFDNNIKDHLN